MRKLMDRFVKDNNIAVKTYCGEDYFVRQLSWLDRVFGAKYVEKWEELKNLIEERFKGNKEAYYAEYTRVKEAAMAFIKENAAYQRFNSDGMDFLDRGRKKSDTPSTSVYKVSNEGKYYISFDIRKANFSILKEYGVFDEFNTWEDFISKFTNIREIIDSKYVRQVILGNCNPKRQTAAEKAYMIDFEKVVDEKLSEEGINYHIVSLTNDEIVVEVDKEEIAAIDEVCKKIVATSETVPIRYDIYRLLLIDFENLPTGVSVEKGYIREFFYGDSVKKYKGGIKVFDIKCVDKIMYPLVLNRVLDEKVTEEDYKVETTYGLATLDVLPDVVL